MSENKSFSKLENKKRKKISNIPTNDQKQNDSIKPPTIVITNESTNNTSNKNLFQMSSKSPNKKRSDLSKKVLPQIIKKQNNNFLKIPGMESKKRKSNSKIIQLNSIENSPNKEKNIENNNNNKSRRDSIISNSSQHAKFPAKRKSILETLKENLIETLEKDKNLELNDLSQDESNEVSFRTNKSHQQKGVNKGIKLTAMPKNNNQNKGIDADINYQKSVRNAVMLRRLEFTERLKKGFLGGKKKKKAYLKSFLNHLNQNLNQNLNRNLNLNLNPLK